MKAQAQLRSNQYIGRFAPSPTGPLHAGSLVAALGSWLDAKAHGGQWLVRMEDTDTPRCKPAFAELILQQLATHGLVSDGPVVTQSQRLPLYETALAHLQTRGLVYPCACSRKEISNALAQQGITPGRHQELVYPGICRPNYPVKKPNPAPKQTAWRLHLKACQATTTAGDAGPVINWQDRRLGAQYQDVNYAVGDFVLQRSDGLFAYQLAVVVDDAAQGVTHVVRGQDLADNTARQIVLQRALGLATPCYLHMPLVLGENGEKLSKQNGAKPLSLNDPATQLYQAARCLDLHPSLPKTQHGSLSDALAEWVPLWANRWLS